MPRSPAQPDQTASECLSRLAEARKYLLSRDYESCVEKVDKSLIEYVKSLSKKNGANDAHSIEDRGSRMIPFVRWGATQHLTYLQKAGKISPQVLAALFKVHNLRNDFRYRDSPAYPRLLERCIAVVEYAIRSGSPAAENHEYAAEGGRFSLPKTRTKVVQRSKAKKWYEHGWFENRSLGPNVEIKRAKYSKWELFEIKLRYLLRKLGFEDCIEEIEDFWYTDLANQVDACGGWGGVFFVIDCTSKKELGAKSIGYKINQTLQKEKAIFRNVDKRYPGKYPNKVSVICTEDVELEERDKQEAKEAGIKLLDSDRVNGWFRYYSTLGIGLRSHIVKSLAGFSPVISDGGDDPFIHYPAFKLMQDGKAIYHLLADPETLLRLGYVYRLEMSDPEGYQRALIRSKVLNINGFLATASNGFANNLVMCFDSLVEDGYWPDFEPLPGQNTVPIYGTLNIPKIHCSAEIIDGQHRLYGYLDATDQQSYKSILDKRRQNDRLSVVAITDPSNTQRASLFVDINSNQTKVNPRQVWALVGSVRPNTLMGYAANVVMALNSGPVFRNLIHIPGVNKSGGKQLNIANLGKGLLDRRLLDKEDEWNLFEGDRRRIDYSLGEIPGPVKSIDEFFRPFSRDNAVSKFVFTNNGANVLLRVFAQLLVFERNRKRKLSKSERQKKIVQPIKDFLRNRDVRELRRKSSNEAVRGELAKELMAVIRKGKGMTGFAADLF